jgi:hypothetical protein
MNKAKLMVGLHDKGSGYHPSVGMSHESQLNTAGTNTAERDMLLDVEAQVIEVGVAESETADDKNVVTVLEQAPLVEPAVQKEPTVHAEDAPSAVPPAAEDITKAEEKAEVSAEAGVVVAEVGLPESSTRSLPG